MTPTWRIHHVPHTHNVMNWYDTTSSKGPRQDPDMKNNEPLWALVLATGQKKHTHQWQLTGARPKMTQERAVRYSDTLHRGPGPHITSNWMLPLQEQTQTSTWETHDTPRNKQVHTPHTGGFHPSLHPFSIPFISITCPQGLCTNRCTDTDAH